jgi:hypothetical protein
VKISLPAHQVVCGEKRIYTKEVITVKMTDKYMVDSPEADLMLAHLHLGTLAAVYQKQPLMHIEYMSGGISV